MSKLLWLDLETTGLDPQKHEILEVGCIITDENFNAQSEFTSVVYPCSGGWIANMSPMAREMHEKNGLLKKIAEPENSLDPIGEVETKLIYWLQENGLFKDIILCGNSIHFDRGFIRQHMPHFYLMLHHRMIDVSSFKVLFNMRYNRGYHYPIPDATHRALDDIKSSIDEMSFYCTAINVNLLSNDTIYEGKK
jgi:oligoribonuclease